MASSQQGSALGQFEGQADVGTAGRPGACAYDAAGQTYAIAGSGAFVWKRMAGDFIVMARAESTGERTLGWMARAGLDADAQHVSAGVRGDGSASLQFQRTRGGPSERLDAAVSGADVVQLERKGDTYTMSVARFGEPLVAVRVENIGLGDDLYVGLFVSSRGEEAATFRDVRIVVPAGEGFNRAKDPFASHLEIVDVASGHRQIVYSTDYVIEAPNWTCDGKALIYNSGGRLYRFDLASKTPEPIDTDYVVGNNNDHVLSFDGAMLAISSSSEDEPFSIVYTVPTGGGTPKRVTPTGPSYLHGWSPDGKYLVFTGWRNGDFDIYRIPADGGDEVRLTTAVGLDDGPEYTPDGRYIYFNSVRSGRMQLWRMQPDGSEQEQLTDDEYNNWFPHISPDGKWVAFVTYLVGEVEPSDHPAAKRVYLRLMPLGGGAPRVLAYLYGGQGTMNVPSWSPDSKSLAFVSNTVSL